jgi:SAM-dependent methyltransferase
MGILQRWFSRRMGLRLHSGPSYRDLYDRHIRFHEESGCSAEEARKEAVGGDFEAFGKVERDALLTLGLSPVDSLIDIGCGSGRLAHTLAAVLNAKGGYLGLDIHPAFLDAASCHPSVCSSAARLDFRLLLGPRLPCPDHSADWVTAFSVMTHIDLEDTFLYLQEAARVLKPTGRAVISYLSTTIPDHWRIFLEEAATPAEERHSRVRNHVLPPGVLNDLAARAGLSILADHPADRPWIKLTESVEIFGRQYASGDTIHLGQSCLVLALP